MNQQQQTAIAKTQVLTPIQSKMLRAATLVDKLPKARAEQMRAVLRGIADLARQKPAKVSGGSSEPGDEWDLKIANALDAFSAAVSEELTELKKSVSELLPSAGGWIVLIGLGAFLYGRGGRR